MQSNKRAAIPQSFLFHISAVQESLAAVRGSLYGNVILATDGSHPEVAQCISEVSQGKSIDMGFIADLAEDPAAVWNRVVAGEGAARRVALTPEVPSSPDAFAQRLFVSKEVDVYTRGGQAHGVPGALNAIHEKMTSILSLWAGPGGDGVNVATDRAQPFRELALLAAEVTRARSLHAAGVLVTDVIFERTGKHLLVVQGSAGTSLTLTSSVPPQAWSDVTSRFREVEA